MGKSFVLLFFLPCLLLLSCSGAIDITDPSPGILSLEFLATDNPEQLIEDVACKILWDSSIVCWVSHIMPDKNLIPRFSINGNVILETGGGEVINGQTRLDFSKPVELVVEFGERKAVYKVYVYAFTGLPICWIDTEDRAPVDSKEEYVRARIRIVEDLVTKSPGDVFESNVQIKGRGNTTWKRFPKKPYGLKFAEKVSLLNEPSDKSWVLLANYADKTLIRNDVTFFLGYISNLEYTPTSHFVDVMLNGSYQGTYQLTDKLKISKNRVNVGDDGFLFEIDDYAPYEEDSRFFRVNHLYQPCVNIKDPDVEYDDENYQYAKQFVISAEEVLFSEFFLDKENGWQRYLDMDSFVDYYIINEITKNTDAMWSSSYMNLKRGGKLKMGPLWDYDLAYGNYSGNISVAEYEGFKVLLNPWYSRLFEDPEFVSKVKERYNYFYGRKPDILGRVNEIASYLKYSAQENNNKWGVLYMVEWPNVTASGSYLNEVSSLKEWISKRMDWLKIQFDAI